MKSTGDRFDRGPDEVGAAVRDAWNGAQGERWVDDADWFDALLEPMGEVVLDAAGLRPGDRVLEVGCGTGRMAMALAAAVGDDGAVVGVDVSAPMLRLASERIAAAGLANVTFVEADAARVDLAEAGFDVVISRFGVMFFVDLEAAFAHLAARIRPGGRMAFVTWRPMAECEFFALPVAVMQRHAPEAAAALAGGPPLPGPFSLSDADQIRNLLGSAGLVDVELTAVDRSLVVGATPDEALTFLRRGGWHQVVRDRAPHAVDTIESDLRRELADRHGPDGITTNGGAWLVTARRP